MAHFGTEEGGTGNITDSDGGLNDRFFLPLAQLTKAQTEVTGNKGNVSHILAGDSHEIPKL